MLKELYFINARELAKELAQNRISEKLAFFHFLAMTVLTGGVISIPIDMQWAGQAPDSILLHIFLFIMVGAIQYWGLTTLYKINSAIDGKDFFLRFAALSLPISVQILIAGILLAMVFGAIVGTAASSFINNPPSEIWLIAEAIFIAIVTALYFKIFISAFKEIELNLHSGE